MIILIFLLWTIFGSFWSVLITRLWEGVNKSTIKWILFGFSHCPKCKKRLKSKNLIPILSYLLQDGSCEYCKKPISRFYPTIEILSGIVFVLTYIASIYWWLEVGYLVFLLAINWLLLLMLIYDFQTYELHVPLWILALWVSLIPQFFFNIWDYGWAFIWSLVFWVVFYGIYYWAKIYVKNKYKKDMEGFGEWDVWLAFLIWTLLPFVMEFNWISMGIGSILELLILFALISSILWIIYYYGKDLVSKYFWVKDKKDWLNYIPFLPFMIMGFWILLFWWDNFIKLMYIGW